MKALQSPMQWAFMRVEALFNRAFGDRLNPLYHLGSITFFLFWVVAGSGLYLYAFFETGVADAYASVEALALRQWWAGGLLRSLHRYASDAMVVTMLLHLLRHFAFDRFRGFRWFSWLTGVALVWGVYVSGINGYMLPWDRLAQFVISTSFEWIDWLPGFGGTLVRNVLRPSSINDRFFSLLAFMHIGVPLVVLLLMFIHVQRVPKARTNPPRPIVISLMLTLTALSLVLPVRSQGGAADLASAVGTLQLDWFLLTLFPLFSVASHAQVWALVVAGTAVLVLLPWLPPKFRRGKEAGFQMTVHPSTTPLRVRPGETLLEAGLRQGVPLPYECRNGGCGKCLCTVLHGQVVHGPYQRSALPDAELALGRALMCCATPLSDLEIEVELAPDAATQSAPSGANSGGTARPPIRTHLARVVRIEPLAADVLQLTLLLPAGQTMPFEAGQYLNIVLDDGQRRAFSFANPPQVQDHVELQVRRIPGGRFTGQVFTQMKVGDALRIEGPLGDFHLRDSDAPILFIAGATGFAPIKSIVEDAFARGITRPMWLYWGVRRRTDLYAIALAEQWQREHAQFHFVPVLSEEGPAEGWTGRTGLVHEALLADFTDLRGHEVYVCGSVKMVEAAVPAFLAQGLDEGFCFSDAFVPAAPRDGG